MVRALNRRILLGLIAISILLFPGIPHNAPAIGQGAMTPPPTPTQSLQEQAGFSSPVLADLQQEGIRWLNEDVAFSAYGHDYRLLSFAPIGVPAGDGNRLDL